MDVLKYIGQPWENERDCWYWFRRIQADEFGRDVTAAMVNHSTWITMIKSAADIMNDDIEDRFGWVETKAPREGDAVFLSRRRHPHHIGVVIEQNGGRPKILHALEGVGIVLDDQASLKRHGWRIYGYWTPIDES